MHDRETRWFNLAVMATLVAMAQFIGETAGLWFSFPARPDWLWALAFATSLRLHPVGAIGAFALCGVVRDFVLGPRLGSAAIAYILVGWTTLSWRFFAAGRGWAFSSALVTVTAFLVALVKHSLDYGVLTHKLMDRVFFVSLGDGILTGIAYTPILILLGLDSFRTWKERG